MKVCMLSTAAAAAVLIPATPASAVDIVIGRTLASACYDASLASTVSRSGLNDCSRSLEEEVLSDDDRASTYVNRGILKMRTGDLAGADRDFDLAIRLDAKGAEAYLNKAFVRLRQGNFGAALPYLDRSIEERTIRPALAHYARAIAHEELGDLRSAYADLNRARDLDPKWSLPVQQLARYKVGNR